MRQRYLLFIFSFAALIVLAIACQKILPSAPGNDQILDGPLDGLNSAETKQFLAGDAAFNDGIFTVENGLGPYFVATSCGSCHAGDGKGHPFTTLTRFGQSDATGNQYMNYGGPQLQNHAIPGFTPEVIPAGAPSAKFMPPATSGLGFLAALTDLQILANADPTDANSDGISGSPNYITPPSYFVPQSWHISFGGLYIGRFGKKAAAIDLLIQTVNAYNQDMGITTTFSPYEPAINGIAWPYPDDVADPEVLANTVLNVVFYLRTLKAPVQRNQSDPDVISGRQIFETINCAACHTPEWTTGAGDISALSNKTFYPYTDLLLHDMGAGLDDGYTEGWATSPEWKTPPLWGLGLSKNSQGGNYYLLHDGRAASIEEAILLHGGEASGSVSQYQGLSNVDKEKLMRFLESL